MSGSTQINHSAHRQGCSGTIRTTGNTQIRNILIEAGADVTARSNLGNKALISSTKQQSTDEIEMSAF